MRERERRGESVVIAGGRYSGAVSERFIAKKEREWRERERVVVFVSLIFSLFGVRARS